mgnify:CR=1 FL=1
MNKQKQKKIAVVMAGGVGPRFWPRSTEKLPKQFIHLIGEGTMLQNTVSRLLPIFHQEDIYIVTFESYLKYVEEQLPYIPTENIILEPFGKNTAPCLALTLTSIGEKYSNDTILCAFPSDHIIYNIREFHHSLELAEQIAFDRKGIVTIGITPTRPEPSFGYVQIKEDRNDLGSFYDDGIRLTTTFAEKPDYETARRFVESGDFLWNSGIFIWRIDTFWESFSHYMPEHYRLFKLLNKHIGLDSYKGVVEHIYRQMQSQSIDYGILEKADNVYVVQSAFTWSDLGNWDELYRLSMKDGRDNVIEGDVVTINTSRSLILSNGKLIGTVGVDNLIVIDSDDGLLICQRGHSEDIIEIVDFMRRKHINKF